MATPCHAANKSPFLIKKTGTDRKNNRMNTERIQNDAVVCRRH